VLRLVEFDVALEASLSPTALIMTARDVASYTRVALPSGLFAKIDAGRRAVQECNGQPRKILEQLCEKLSLSSVGNGHKAWYEYGELERLPDAGGLTREERETTACGSQDLR
jgi:hypothetical protein